MYMFVCLSSILNPSDCELSTFLIVQGMYVIVPSIDDRCRAIFLTIHLCPKISENYSEH